MPSPFYVSESQTSPAQFSPQTHTFFSRNIYPLVLRSDLRNPYTINVGTPTQYLSHGLHHYSTYLVFVFSYNQLNILLVILHLASPLRPSPVFSGLTPPVFFFLSITPFSIFTFTMGYNPLPSPNVQCIFPMCFSSSVFHSNILEWSQCIFHKCESNCP